MNKFLILQIVFLLWISSISAQEEIRPNLRWYLSEDKSSYAGMLMVNQIWTRYIQNNPDKNGVEQPSDFDLGIRRSRLIFYTYLMDKVFIYTQVGMDGLTLNSVKNPVVNLLNAQTEYIFIKDKLHLGFGLNTWNGVSRYNNSKLLEFLVADNPGFAYPVGGTFDRGGRQLGIYAKGTLGKLHYRVSVAKPFKYGIDSISTPVTTERINNNFAVKGYFTWQFFDIENTLFPYMTMNNLGRQKLLNIGAGFYYHPEAILAEAKMNPSSFETLPAKSLITAGSKDLLQYTSYLPSEICDILITGVDLFLDLPTRNNGAVTFYLCYYYNSFGPDYLRSTGKMNVSEMDAKLALPQGPGNSEWETGTGNIVRGEVGYLLPGQGFKNRFQPFGAFTWKNFEALGEASFQYDVGLNWFLYGHNMKWTFQYSSRPVYTLVHNKNIIDQYKGQIILQTQIFF